MKRFFAVATPILLLIVCGAIPLLAADPPATVAGAATQAKFNDSMFMLVIKSGAVEWVELILSVVGFSMAIHRLITIKPDTMVPGYLVDDMHNILSEGLDDEAIEEAQNAVAGDMSMLGEILNAALDKRDFGYESMREAADLAAGVELNKYMTQINYLAFFAAIGPMLGLLGTVTGMIGAFMKMAAEGGSPDPSLLAYDIGGAMITTATGLIIAIPMMFFFFLLRGRINRAFLDANALTNEVLAYFRGK